MLINDSTMWLDECERKKWHFGGVVCEENNDKIERGHGHKDMMSRFGPHMAPTMFQNGQEVVPFEKWVDRINVLFFEF